mmetsp:Transcript_14995/g.23930  ORF Transcript_14995/g.23930 Transcript_14995/m.23930 type:complete len:220 (-) Transcript_14995:91-750(-)
MSCHSEKGEELIVAAGETMFSTNAVLRARTPSLRFSSARSKKLENQLKNGLPWSLGATRYGVGAFAIKKLPKGFVVDTFLSKVDTTARKVDLSWEQIKAYGVPKEVQSRVQTLYQSEDERVTIPSFGFNLKRLSSFLNHSAKERVNCTYEFFGESVFANIVTIREVACGEELTIDYDNYLSETQKELPMFSFLRGEGASQETSTNNACSKSHTSVCTFS